MHYVQALCLFSLCYKTLTALLIRLIQNKERKHRKMQIIVSDFDSYKPPFSLWSIFYVQCGEACFPEHEHWDLTTTLLEMWLDNMCGLLFGVSTHVLSLS